MEGRAVGSYRHPPVRPPSRRINPAFRRRGSSGSACLGRTRRPRQGRPSRRRPRRSGYRLPRASVSRPPAEGPEVPEISSLGLSDVPTDPDRSVSVGPDEPVMSGCPFDLFGRQALFRDHGVLLHGFRRSHFLGSLGALGLVGRGLPSNLSDLEPQGKSGGLFQNAPGGGGFPVRPGASGD